MFSDRQNEMARCVKSRQTPKPDLLTSVAVDCAGAAAVPELQVLVHVVADRLHAA